MARRLRITALCVAATAAVVVLALWAAYAATRQVRPFYKQALQLDAATLERGKQELESQATALYTDTRQAGAWRALFTDEQINGWLAAELSNPASSLGQDVMRDVREPRIAITPNTLTLGFRTTQGGVDTVISVDASVFLIDESEVAIRLVKVRAGTLPLPVAMVTEQLAAACRNLRLPVMWTQQDGEPVAMIKIGNVDDSQNRRLCLDSIELNESGLYVAGHTEEVSQASSSPFSLNELEVRLSPEDEQSMLEIARKAGRPQPKGTER